MSITAMYVLPAPVPRFTMVFSHRASSRSSSWYGLGVMKLELLLELLRLSRGITAHLCGSESGDSSVSKSELPSSILGQSFRVF